jgi:hypothetical protein
MPLKEPPFVAVPWFSGFSGANEEIQGTWLLGVGFI